MQRLSIVLTHAFCYRAAIQSKAGYLLTGDARHFDHLYGKQIAGVLVVRSAQYFERRQRA